VIHFVFEDSGICIGVNFMEGEGLTKRLGVCDGSLWADYPSADYFSLTMSSYSMIRQIRHMLFYVL